MRQIHTFARIPWGVCFLLYLLSTTDKIDFNFFRRQCVSFFLVWYSKLIFMTKKKVHRKKPRRYSTVHLIMRIFTPIFFFGVFVVVNLHLLWGGVIIVTSHSMISLWVQSIRLYLIQRKDQYLISICWYNMFHATHFFLLIGLIVSLQWLCSRIKERRKWKCGNFSNFNYIHANACPMDMLITSSRLPCVIIVPAQKKNLNTK